MQSYKILHFCFLLGYTGYLQVVVFLSYSKSVHCQSTLTHLQKNVCHHRGNKVFSVFVGFPRRLELTHNSASGEEKGDFNPSCCHGDNPWWVPRGLTGFPLSYDSFLLDGGREGNDFWGKGSLWQPHDQNKCMQRSLESFSSPSFLS